MHINIREKINKKKLSLKVYSTVKFLSKRQSAEGCLSYTGERGVSLVFQSWKIGNVVSLSAPSLAVIVLV